MAVYGNIAAFDENKELFADYADRCDAFLLANDIADDRKASLFLATIGPESYKLLKNLCQPTKPSSKSYEQLKTLLMNHYEPAPIVIAERYKFWSAHQAETETVADYMVRLKKLSSSCSFGSFLDEALRDRLVSGLHSKMARTQRHLLTVRDLTFSAAKERCVADEMAGKASLDHLGPGPTSGDTNRIYQGRRRVQAQDQGQSHHKPSGRIMSSDLQDIFELSKDALSLHSLDSLEECIVKLEQIREKLMNVDRGKLDSNIIWNLCGLIRGEMSIWSEGYKPSVKNLEVSTQALFCLRNTFVNCSRIQLMVAETDVLRDVVLGCIKWVFLSKYEKDSGISDNDQNVNPSEDREWQDKVSQLAKASVTCLGNLVAANTATRRIMWPYLLPLLCPMLKYSEEKVSCLSSMVIFNCLLEEDLKKDLCSCSDVDDVICDLLTLYLGGKSSNEKTVCFVLYTLEMVLCCDGRVGTVWSSLSGNQQLLLLDILSNILEGKSGSKCGTLSPSSVTFLIGVFKNEADKILRTHTSELKDNSSQVVARLLSFLCLLGATEYWGPTLKEDNSLLITTVSLLQCMNDIGSVGGNEFSRMGLADMANDEQLRKAENHPAYGFKRDLIRLIASLAYRHKANQDQVRDLGGLTLILESSQFDAKNPGIKEVSIFAIRNLLEGNLENQQIVKDLEYRGSAENQDMQLSHVNGMVVVQGSSSSSPNGENL